MGLYCDGTTNQPVLTLYQNGTGTSAKPLLQTMLQIIDLIRSLCFVVQEGWLIMGWLIDIVCLTNMAQFPHILLGHSVLRILLTELIWVDYYNKVDYSFCNISILLA